MLNENEDKIVFNNSDKDVACYCRKCASYRRYKR